MLVACPKKEGFDEALGLVETAGFVVEEVVALCKKPHPSTYVGPGRLERIKDIVKEKEIDAVIIYGNPKPSQIYRIMSELGNVEVLDRTTLILKIFELHAGSKEAKLQIELARLKYELTRAKEYVRRRKKGEQVDFLGPGEYAVNFIIRGIKSRMKKIEKELERIRKMREHQKSRRMKRLGMPEVAVAGYTCAGKTALINALSKMSLKEGAEMFTTIMPKHVRVKVGELEGIFVDTVGFIESVPPQIIEAFHATLSEIALSDSIVLLVDSSEPEDRVINKLLSSLETLGEIGVVAKPLVVALNKVDVAEDWKEKLEKVNEIVRDYYDWVVDVIPISAKTGYNLEELVRIAISSAKESRIERL